MTRTFLPFCVLAAVVVWAQSKPATPSAPAAGQSASNQQPANSASSLAPDAPVLTIKGLCSQPGASAIGSSNPACTTVVTRAQFERLVEVLKAGKDAQSRRQLATAYPQILVQAHEAVERGLDKQPRVQERLSFLRLQVLSQELLSEIRDKASDVPEKDIAEYYRQNASQFEQVSLERIVIPNHVQPKAGEQSKTQEQQDENAMTRLAEALRARAAAGEDFIKLQKQAYDAAGLSGDTEPNPHLEKLRRHGLPSAHAAVFDLKPGEVSPIISDVSGHYIYKLDSREVAPLEAVKLEISNTLRRQRLEEMIHQVQQPFTTDLNQAYFGAEGKKDKE